MAARRAAQRERAQGDLELTIGCGLAELERATTRVRDARRRRARGWRPPLVEGREESAQPVLCPLAAGGRIRFRRLTLYR
jgi:hypothetical protein